MVQVGIRYDGTCCRWCVKMLCVKKNPPSRRSHFFYQVSTFDTCMQQGAEMDWSSLRIDTIAGCVGLEKEHSTGRFTFGLISKSRSVFPRYLKTYFFLVDGERWNHKNWLKRDNKKQAYQHDTFKLKLHWQLQANDQACTPSFEHIRQTPKSEKSTVNSREDVKLNSKMYRRSTYGSLILDQWLGIQIRRPSFFRLFHSVTTTQFTNVSFCWLLFVVSVCCVVVGSDGILDIVSQQRVCSVWLQQTELSALYLYILLRGFQIRSQSSWQLSELEFMLIKPPSSVRKPRWTSFENTYHAIEK